MKAMTAIRQIDHASGKVLSDYFRRHCHPANALLHLFGVPMVFASIYQICKGHTFAGVVLFVLGYFLQYLGHKAQGNEVGEVRLIKRIWQAASGRQR